MNNKENKIIVGDIGGTNSRFAIFSLNKNNKIIQEDELWLKTCAFQSFIHLTNSIKNKNSIYNIEKYDTTIIAVPGPITPNGNLNFPNVKWGIDQAKIEQIYQKTDIVFINDFVAQAYGCLTEASNNAIIIQSGKTTTSTPDIAIVGAGTGIGFGALKKINEELYIPLPSEAGHSTFPFITTSEMKYREFVIKNTGKNNPVCDDIVSGSGLSLLHQYITERVPVTVYLTRHEADKKNRLQIIGRSSGDSLCNYLLFGLCFLRV